MSQEVKAPCKVSIIAKQCECGGEMQRVYSNTTTFEYPPRYLHKCNKCGKTEILDKSYPYQEYSYDLPKVEDD